MNMLLRELERRLPGDCRQRVRRAQAEFNQLIRRRLDDELRFGLQGSEQAGTKTARISIKLAQGYPAVLRTFFSKPEEDYVTEATELIGLHEEDIDQLERSSEEIVDLLRILHDSPPWTRVVEEYRSALERTAELSRMLKKGAEQASLAQRVFAIQDDILGTYEPTSDNSGTINLYWQAIGLAAQLLHVRIEDLAVVVLIHELAHGYTHLGKDIDNQAWESGLMLEVQNRPVVEGIAQYYTEIISEQLGDVKRPSIHHVYLKLRRQQRGLYRIHDDWTREFSSEVVRSAFVKYRRNDGVALGFFEDLLAEERDRMRAGQRPLHPRLEEDLQAFGPLRTEAGGLIDDFLIHRTLGEVTAPQPADAFAMALGQEWELPVDLPVAFRVSPWLVAMTPQFTKSVQKQGKPTRARVLEAILELTESPVSVKGNTIKPLVGDFKGLWRYRLGDHRLIYHADKSDKLVTLLDFASRGSVYDS